MEFGQTKSRQNNLSTTPVIHVPEQIRDARELVVGKEYIRRFLTDTGETISSLPFRVLSIDSRNKTLGVVGESHIAVESMADCGILPYETSRGPQWNARAYLIAA